MWFLKLNQKSLAACIWAFGMLVFFLGGGIFLGTYSLYKPKPQEKATSRCSVDSPDWDTTYEQLQHTMWMDSSHAGSGFWMMLALPPFDCNHRRNPKQAPFNWAHRIVRNNNKLLFETTQFWVVRYAAIDNLVFWTSHSDILATWCLYLMTNAKLGISKISSWFFSKQIWLPPNFSHTNKWSLLH